MEPLITIVGLLLCFYLSHQYLKRKYGNNTSSSIPFVTEGCLPIIGHALSLGWDRKTFYVKCSERYGSVFQIRVFYKTLTVLLNPRDWVTVMRHPNVETAFEDMTPQVFGISTDAFSKIVPIRMRKQSQQREQF